MCTLQHTATHCNTPLTEETRLKIFGSPDLPDFWVNLLSDGDSVYLPENLFEILGTHVKTNLNCTGTPMKNCWKFWQSYLFQVRSPPFVAATHCNTLQPTATHCDTLRHAIYACILHASMYVYVYIHDVHAIVTNAHTCNVHINIHCIYIHTHCNTLQHTATHCNILQHEMTCMRWLPMHTLIMRIYTYIPAYTE